MTQYLIILEPTNTGYCAYVPDLDGCIAAADTKEETIALMQEAIAFHLEGMALDGDVIPQPQSEAAMVEINSPSHSIPS